MVMFQAARAQHGYVGSLHRTLFLCFSSCPPPLSPPSSLCHLFPILFVLFSFCCSCSFFFPFFSTIIFSFVVFSRGQFCFFRIRCYHILRSRSIMRLATSPCPTESNDDGTKQGKLACTATQTRVRQVLLVPSAFTVKAHWEILLRARAIETQAYVI